MRSAQSSLRSSTVMKANSGTCASWWPKPTLKKAIQDKSIEMNSSVVVITSAKRDRGRRGGEREHEQREDLADEIAEMGRERDQVDVDGEQDQLDRHQDHDDVLAVDEDAENAEREQDRGDGEVMAQSDRHVRVP